MRTRLAAACLGSLLALSTATLSPAAYADGASLSDATDVQKMAAQTRYQEGMKAYQLQDFETARRGFNQSFETVASPNALLMVVNSLVGLKRHVEAYQQANKTARLADAAAALDPKYAQTAKAARAEAAKLREKLGFVSIMGIEGAPDGTSVKIAGQVIDKKDWGKPIPVEPGVVPVTINNKAFPAVKVAAGGQATVNAAAVGGPPPPKPSPPHADDNDDGSMGGTYRGPNRLVISAIAGSVGVAGFIATGVFGGLAQAKFDGLQEKCPGQVCPIAELEDDANSGKVFQTISNTGLVFGVLGMVTAGSFLAWHFIDPDADDYDTDMSEEAKLKRKYAPQLRVGPGNLSLVGSF